MHEVYPAITFRFRTRRVSVGCPEGLWGEAPTRGAGCIREQMMLDEGSQAGDSQVRSAQAETAMLPQRPRSRNREHTKGMEGGGRDEEAVRKRGPSARTQYSIQEGQARRRAIRCTELTMGK